MNINTNILKVSGDKTPPICLERHGLPLPIATLYLKNLIRFPGNSLLTRHQGLARLYAFLSAYEEYTLQESGNLMMSGEPLHKNLIDGFSHYLEE